MGKLWKQCTLGIHEDRYRSRKAEMLEDSAPTVSFLYLFRDSFHIYCTGQLMYFSEQEGQDHAPIISPMFSTLSGND